MCLAKQRVSNDAYKLRKPLSKDRHAVDVKTATDRLMRFLASRA